MYDRAVGKANGKQAQRSRGVECGAATGSSLLCAGCLGRSRTGAAAPGLSPRDRGMITVAALMARIQTIEMPFTFAPALENGVKPGELPRLFRISRFIRVEQTRCRQLLWREMCFSGEALV